MSLLSLVRRLRHGRSIVVVSGLPRSGTSMAMKMLEAGGLQVVTDGLRQADDSNPNGYYEFEPVKQLDKSRDASWLADSRGKAVKIVSFLLTQLPETYNYQVLFMDRDLNEVISSQNRMLDDRAEPRGADDDLMRRHYAEHLEGVARFLARRPCFQTLRVSYEDAMFSPVQQASRINAFLGGRLDEGKMARVADAALYRNRRARALGRR